MATRNDKALVTLLIGSPDYAEQWRRKIRPSWEEYAGRHGYDIVAVEDYIDPTPRARERAPNWQKCLIPEHPDLAGYDRLVWVDSDVLINFLAAPCIAAACPADRVGLVGMSHYPEALLRSGMLGPYDDYPAMIADSYRAAGLEPVADWANTGVFVISPRHHAAALRHVYDTYAESPASAKEEIPLSHHLFGSGLAHSLDPRFNWPWLYRIYQSYPFLLMEEYRNDLELAGLCVNTAWHDTWFMHFTGETPATRHHAGLIISWAGRDHGLATIHRHFGSGKKSP